MSERKTTRERRHEQARLDVNRARNARDKAITKLVRAEARYVKACRAVARSEKALARERDERTAAGTARLTDELAHALHAPLDPPPVASPPVEPPPAEAPPPAPARTRRRRKPRDEGDALAQIIGE